MRLSAALAIAVAPALFVLGCSGGGGGSTTGPSPEPSPSSNTVTIAIVGTSGSSSYSPNPVTASTGASLVWRNNDSVVHQIALDDGSGTTATIAPGATSGALTLRGAAGTYHCTIHPTMVGSINGASTPPPSGGTGGGDPTY
jgi:plastocyanin